MNPAPATRRPAPRPCRKCGRPTEQALKWRKTKPAFKHGEGRAYRVYVCITCGEEGERA